MRKTSQAYNSSQSPWYMKTKSICYVRGLSWRRLVETNSICPETLNYVLQNKQAEIDASRFELFSSTENEPNESTVQKRCYEFNLAWIWHEGRIYGTGSPNSLKDNLYGFRLKSRKS